MKTKGNETILQLPITYDSDLVRHRTVWYNLKQFTSRWSLTRMWLLAGVRASYKQTWFGLLWPLIGPLTNSFIYTALFSLLLKVGTDSKTPYVPFVFVGTLTWSYFASFITSSGSSLIGNIDLMTKAVFPREMLMLGPIVESSITLGIGLIIAFLMILATGISLTGWALLFPFLLLVQIIMMIGLALFIASIAVLFRDATRLVGLVLQFAFYLTPIVYPVTRVPEVLQPIYKLNPMTTLLVAYRNVLLEGQAPEWGYLLATVVFSLVVFISGYTLFKQLEWRFADTL